LYLDIQARHSITQLIIKYKYFPAELVPSAFANDVAMIRADTTGRLIADFLSLRSTDSGKGEDCLQNLEYPIAPDAICDRPDIAPGPSATILMFDDFIFYI
jgi:hypothetical protein